MPRVDSYTSTLARKKLLREKIFTLPRLASLLGCSSRAAQSRLKLWEAYTSYNKNGKYYVLPEIPSFDHHGLWRHKDIAFSKHGNLKKTIIHLVTVSPAGLSGRQLGEILSLSPQSFLHHFKTCPGIHREKYKGVFIYFSEDSQIYEKQLQQRHSLSYKPATVTITDPEAILILVAIIRHHGISALEIVALPEIKKRKIELASIQGFLEHHGLVKKIPD